MGTRVVETQYDDLDESTNDVRTVSLSLDGQAVEIDLSAENFKKLSDAVAPYLEAGRKSSISTSERRRRPSAAATTPANTSDTQAIREWAQANGHDVNSRGRIAKSVVMPTRPHSAPSSRRWPRRLSAQARADASANDLRAPTAPTPNTISRLGVVIRPSKDGRLPRERT